MAVAIALHLGLALIWLQERAAPGRAYLGSQARLNVQLYPKAEDRPRPRIEARTTASTGQAAQTRPGGTRSTASAVSADGQAAVAAAQVASPRGAVIPDDPLSQSRWRDTGSPWQEELEAAARAQIADAADQARSPWPYDQPLPALPFDDYGETPLVTLPPDDEEDEGPSVRFLGMTIGVSPIPVLVDSPVELGRWISDNPTTRAMERMQRSECQPGPDDGPEWRAPGGC